MVRDYPFLTSVSFFVRSMFALFDLRVSSNRIGSRSLSGIQLVVRRATIEQPITPGFEITSVIGEWATKTRQSPCSIQMKLWQSSRFETRCFHRFSPHFLFRTKRKKEKEEKKTYRPFHPQSVIGLGGISVPLASPSKPWSGNILKGKRRMWYFGRFSDLYVFLLFSSFPSFFVACGRGGIYTRQNKKKRMQRDTMKESTA